VSGAAKKIVVLDYGSGNLRSAERAIARHGADVTVTADFDTALAAEGLVVPGVGAFAACMKGLREVRGDQIIGRRLAGGRPVLGICVGMQILFEKGVEHGITTDGCAEWPGAVERLAAPILPHMGWVGAVRRTGRRDALLLRAFLRRPPLGTEAGPALRRAAGDVGRARRAVRGGGGERPAVRHAVPPGKVRRRGRRGPEELALDRLMSDPMRPVSDL